MQNNPNNKSRTHHITHNVKYNCGDRNCVALFFVASPLHYLAARTVARYFETNSRCIVVLYRPDARQFVHEDDWDAIAYAPWPRFDPLPGLFGRHRRLLSNLRDVAAIVGRCETLLIHSPVFDSEAINYFLNGLPRLCGATTMHARILPDGLLNVSRHPLNLFKQYAQYLRKLRRLVSPQLNYWCFSGDRIGSDALFVDRIYTLAGFPHDYSLEKTFNLPPLAIRNSGENSDAALIIGQPLISNGLLTKSEHDAICIQIADWLKINGINRVVYKAHPRNLVSELRIPRSDLLEISEPLETHMANHSYRAVIGVFSTSLFFARQIYGPEIPVISFGNHKIRYKNSNLMITTTKLMNKLKIEQL